MKKIISIIIAAAFIILSLPVYASPDNEVSAGVSGYVSCTGGDIEIASSNKTPSIYVDSENDYAGAVRAVNDLKSDIAAVTGVEANITDDYLNADIIVGTIGKSQALNDLMSEGALDVSEIKGEWEAFTLQNVNGKLVIAGADKRGTIYGIYDLSEKMGVSPWEWWADVTPSHSDALYVSLPENGYTEGEPSVKYRGIFINQEYNLNRWSISLNEDGGYMNTETYEKIFELLLRLKANYMWPAMHEYSPAFNLNPQNASKADEYGIVMGSSHCEMLLRNNMGELLAFQEQWIAEHPDKKLYMFRDGSLNADVAYDYTDYDADGNPVDNKEFIEDYWRERVRANGAYENVYTIGMRGVHDGTWDPVNADTDTEKIALLEEIIAKQREILSEEIGKPAEEIPQVFIPYKEIATLYNKGLEIPDDVTIMFTNDNYGHVRQGMTEEERTRSGGGGIYYHVSYYGRPSSVIWNGGTQLGLIKEEMSKAYDCGADTIWLLNVGPLKPFENQMEYFLDLGRNIDEMRTVSIQDYTADNARRYFGFSTEQAEEYASIQCEFLEAVNSRRPEFQVQGLYSLTSYGDEAQKIADKYGELLKRSQVLYDSLPEDKKPAFYELQLYAVKSANNIINNYVGADRSALYKAQNRGAGVNKYAAQSNSGGKEAIEADTEVYNTMLGGKWNKIINPFQTRLHISSDIKIAAAVPETVSELGYTEMGIAAENQQDLNTQAVLEFSGYTKDVRFIDIFNRGTGYFDWKASSDADWIVFNKESGRVYDDDRIYAGIDWSKAPEGISRANITITQYIGENAVKSEQAEVVLNNNTAELPEKTYAEANGYVSIEAEHYSNSVAKSISEGKLGNGVVPGNEPKLIAEYADGMGVIAVYGADGRLESIQTSNTYTDGAYVFESPLNPSEDKTVKGMVWSSAEKMVPISDVYGCAQLSGGTQYEWKEQDDLGRSGNSMKFVPDTARSIDDNSAYLEYDVYFESTGTFDVDVYRMPTLNERGSVKFAVGIDGEMPSILTGTSKYSGGTNDKWAQGVLNNNETLTTSITVNEAGIHKIRLCGIDPGVIIDKIVITTGEKYDSFYGAPESYNTTYNNKAAEMPAASEASTEITGDITELFSPKLYTYGMNLNGDTVEGVDIIKLSEVSDAQLTVAAYGSDGAMLASHTQEADFSQDEINQKTTVPVSFDIPEGTSQVQIVIYDGKDTLNALSPSYTSDIESVSLMASYDEGSIALKTNIEGYAGKEAICMITSADDGKLVYIRQETVSDTTFKTIRTGELDGAYNINIGVAGEGIIASEKAYTDKNIETDNPEESVELYKWDFSDESQTASEGSNIPVISGNAAYDSETQTVQMTSTDKSGGKLNVTFDNAVKPVQGEKITVVSKIAYGRQSGKYMDYSITDSNGNELIKSHINLYSSTAAQSIQIGSQEVLESGLPAGIAVSNKNNSGYDNGFSTFTAVLDADTNTITLNISNIDGESTYTGKFPEGTSYDVAALNFSTTHTYAARSCYVDDISVIKTIAPSYTMSFDIQNSSGGKIDNADVEVTDAKYGTKIAPQNDGTYHLCDGLYNYTVTADGYETAIGELELSQATSSKAISVVMQGSGSEDTEKPASTPEAEPENTPKPSLPPEESFEYDNTAGSWKFDFGAETAEGYIGVSHDKSFTDNLDYGFIGIKEEDYKLAGGEYMDGFRIVKGQTITLSDGNGTAEEPNNDFVAVSDPQYPIRFTMSAENGGYYNVKVTLANASETEPANVSLFTERRHQLLTNTEIQPGGILEYEFNADVETYYQKSLNGQYKDDTISIEVAGDNAAIASMEVTKLPENGRTLWVLSDSTGCDQPTNFPYFNLGSLAGVGQGLTKYLPADIAMSNQGDGGIASSDTYHYNCAKNAYKEGDYLYVEYGHNETSVDGYKKNLEKYYNDCHEAGVKMIVAGPIDRCQTKQFDSDSGQWSSTLSAYSQAGKEFVEEKLNGGALDIAFVDLNAGWIEFLNETSERVKNVRGSDTYEADSVYYYYRYKSSGIDTTHINEAGADNAAYIFFKEAKRIVEENADAQAAVLAELVNGMREQEPYKVSDEIIKAGKVPNSYYPEIPAEEYEGYEAKISSVSFNSGVLSSVTAKVGHYTGLESKDIPYAVAVVEIYDQDGGLKDTYYSTAGSKYDATNGNGKFTLEFNSDDAVLPDGGSYRAWLQGFTIDNAVMEGDEYRISDYYTSEDIGDSYLIGDMENIEQPDTFMYYGVREGADLSGNNGWYIVGSSEKSATLERETTSDGTFGYAKLTKSSEKGSYVVYRTFDNAVSSGKIMLNTDLYYEDGYMRFTLSNKTSSPNGGYDEHIDCFAVNDGILLDSNGEELGSIPRNEWLSVCYELDMDYGVQTLSIGDDVYEYTAEGMDSVIPENVTFSQLEQLNISGSSSAVMSAGITNTSLKNVLNEELPNMTLTIADPDFTEGSAMVWDNGEMTVTAAMNSIITITAEPADGYVFAGWFEGDTMVSGATTAKIRLHRNIELLAKFEVDDDPIDYMYKQNCSLLTADNLAENGWTSENAQSSITVQTDDEHGNYVYFSPSTTRNMKLMFPEMQTDEPYVIEMDFGISSGNNAMSEFTILSTDTEVNNNTNVSGGYLLKFTSTAKSSSSTKSMVWSINDNADETITFTQNGTNPTWAHLKMTVDPLTGEAEIIVTENGEEIYKNTLQTVDTSSNMAVGFNFKAGKSYSKGQFDNIRIYTAAQAAE